MARHFNGSSSLNFSASVNLFSSTTFTIATWVNPDNLSGFMGLIAGGGSSVEFRVNQTTGTLSLLKQNIANIGTSSGAISASAWSHVIVSYDGTNYAFYINGAASGSGSSAQTFAFSNYQLGGTTGEQLTGSLADFAIWSVILTQAEATALGSGVRRPHQIRPVSLTSFFPLDGYDHLALDRSVYKRNPVNSGSTFVPGPPKISPLKIVPFQQTIGTAVAAAGVAFRRSLSQFGTRTGSRQLQGWG